MKYNLQKKSSKNLFYSNYGQTSNKIESIK